MLARYVIPPVSFPFTKFSTANEFDDEAVLVDEDELLMDAADKGLCFVDGEAFNLLSLANVSENFGESVGDFSC